MRARARTRRGFERPDDVDVPPRLSLLTLFASYFPLFSLSSFPSSFSVSLFSLPSLLLYGTLPLPSRAGGLTGVRAPFLDSLLKSTPGNCAVSTIEIQKRERISGMSI